MKLCGFEAGLDKPFFLIAGPCVIESLQLGKMRALLETMMALDAATKRAGFLENPLQD